MMPTTARDKVREKNILEITFAKVYGEIDDYPLTQNTIAKIYASLIDEARDEEMYQKKETTWEKNRYF